MAATDTTTAIERELEIAARPETVWAFLLDPERAVRWMGITAAFDARPGGAYRIEVVPGEFASGEWVELDPPRRLVMTWGWEPSGMSAVAPGSTTVEWNLEPRGEGTVLRFRHSGLRGADAVTTHGHGWDHYLPRLRTVAAGGDAGPDPWLTRA